MAAVSGMLASRKPIGTIALGTIGVVGGVSAVAIAGGFDNPLVGVPDLVVGLAFTAFACYCIPRSPPTALLAASFAGTWFVGSVLPVAVFWHRGVLIHLLLAFPNLWPSGRWPRAAVIGGYAVSLAPVAWGNDAIGAAMAVAVFVAVAAHSRAKGEARSAPRTATRAIAAGFATVVVVGAVARSVIPDNAAVIPFLAVYALILVGGAVALGLASYRPDPARVTDLVVELGYPPFGGPDDALAHAVGATSVADPLLARAVGTASRLAAAHAALQEDLRRSVDEVAASRRRILHAADDERHQLRVTLESIVTEPLRQLARRLDDTADSAGAGGGAGAGAGAGAETTLGRARKLVDLAVGELDQIGNGLHPAELHGGLRASLAALVSRSSVPVTVAVPDERFPRDVEVTAHYVCAEALANCEKHAQASAASIEVRASDTELEVTITDDGRGGATMANGFGLRGLADRVAAIGGRLSVVSPPGTGTRVRATLPLQQRTVTPPAVAVVAAGDAP